MLKIARSRKGPEIDGYANTFCEILDSWTRGDGGEKWLMANGKWQMANGKW